MEVHPKQIISQSSRFLQLFWFLSYTWQLLGEKINILPASWCIFQLQKSTSILKKKKNLIIQSNLVFHRWKRTMGCAERKTTWPPKYYKPCNSAQKHSFVWSNTVATFRLFHFQGCITLWWLSLTSFVALLQEENSECSFQPATWILAERFHFHQTKWALHK